MKVLVVCNGKYKVLSMSNDGVVQFSKSSGMKFHPEDAHPVLWDKGWYKLFPRYMAAFGEPQNRIKPKDKMINMREK